MSAIPAPAEVIAANPSTGGYRIVPDEEHIGKLSRAQWLLMLLAPVLLWPALINGGAFFFPDTSAYVRGVDAMVFRATGHRTAWTGDHVERVAARANAAAPQVAMTAAPQPKPVLLGRSPFYGALTWLGVVTGTFWTTLVVQALLAWGACLGLLRHVIDPARREFAWGAVGLLTVLAVTPLPFFASMLMPDILSGLALVAMAALIVGWRRETMGARAGWLALASYAALAHASHVLILLAVAVPMLLYAAARRRLGMAGGAVAVVGAAMVGLGGDLLFARAVTAITHQPAIRPPFLTARLVEDGPGLHYLRENCGRAPFVLCDYQGVLPLRSDSLLWSADPRTGVFSAVAYDKRRQLAAEQGPFVLAVVADRPLAVVASSFRSAVSQFASNGLAEFNQAPLDRDGILRQLPMTERVGFAASPSARRAVPVTMTETATALMLPIAILLIAVGLIDARTRRVALIGVVVTMGWVANNVICGAMSTPHERYQARVVWAVIAAAALLVMHIVRLRNGERGIASAPA